MSKPQNNPEMPKKKKHEKCSENRKYLWFLFTGATLLSRAILATSLLVIAIKINPLKEQADIFNNCVDELSGKGESISKRVNYCNGGK